MLFCHSDQNLTKLSEMPQTVLLSYNINVRISDNFVWNDLEMSRMSDFLTFWLYSQNVRKGPDQAKCLRNFHACLKTPAYKENHKDEKNFFAWILRLCSKIDNKHTWKEWNCTLRIVPISAVISQVGGSV